jgi:hypothetical protein
MQVTDYFHPSLCSTRAWALFVERNLLIASCFLKQDQIFLNLPYVFEHFLSGLIGIFSQQGGGDLFMSGKDFFRKGFMELLPFPFKVAFEYGK